MDNIKTNEYYAGKILADICYICRHMEKTNREMFESDEILQDAMMFRLIQISENSRKLSDDYKLAKEQVPWLAMAGLRNRIVHDYGNVDLTIVFDTLKKDIPDLLKILTEENV